MIAGENCTIYSGTNIPTIGDPVLVVASNISDQNGIEAEFYVFITGRTKTKFLHGTLNLGLTKGLENFIDLDYELADKEIFSEAYSNLSEYLREELKEAYEQLILKSGYKLSETTPDILIALFLNPAYKKELKSIATGSKRSLLKKTLQTYELYQV